MPQLALATTHQPLVDRVWEELRSRGVQRTHLSVTGDWQDDDDVRRRVRVVCAITGLTFECLTLIALVQVVNDAEQAFAERLALKRLELAQPELGEPEIGEVIRELAYYLEQPATWFWGRVPPPGPAGRILATE